MASEELDKKNFENIVLFYRDELKELDDGTRARELFPKGLRRRLLDLGVLVYRRGRSGLRYLLSATTKDLLNNMPASAI
ncbi:MAG TPA: hypothetical protein VM050_03075 [Patescibacteria group bacterium]|nr:hypothetical protein [Patescibacteria group bacterium]